MKTKVLLREENKFVDVKITDSKKPTIPENLVERWQTIISLVAEILDVPAGLIMKTTKTHMEVFLKSQNEESPYPEDGKDTLGHGLYCETVIGKDDALHIDNSLNHEAWKDNPDVALNMISYYGLPIKWGDGVFFGTICALDSKTNEFDEKYRTLLLYFKDMIELDLILLEQNMQLEKETDTDFLTGVANRKKLEEKANELIDEFVRYDHLFGLIMVDIDKFKQINDVHGHVTGDRILKAFADVASKRLRKYDMISRYGGDEFVILVRETNTTAIHVLMNDIRNLLKKDKLLEKHNIEFSYGAVIVNKSYASLEEMFKKADELLYIDKKRHNL